MTVLLPLFTLFAVIGVIARLHDIAVCKHLSELQELNYDSLSG